MARERSEGGKMVMVVWRGNGRRDGDGEPGRRGSAESDGGGGLEEGSVMMKDGLCVRWRWTCVKG